MIPALEKLQNQLKQLPGLGYRSAERIALHLLVEKPERLQPLLESFTQASHTIKRCPTTGNLTDGDVCPIYADSSRERSQVCVVETVPDAIALERAQSFRGIYHVLHGKLAPIQGVGPEQLNFSTLQERIESGEITELLLALSNDIEGEATCHYIQNEIVGSANVQVTRIGFGLPSGGGLTYADSATLKSALASRRAME